jgi:dTDP-glucose 4,6-dehydratase
MPKILITGSTGFFAQNLIRKAIHYNLPYTFVGLDSGGQALAISNLFINKNYKFYFNDVIDHKLLLSIFRYEKPDLVIHGAFSPEPQNNLAAIRSVVAACQECKVSKLLYLSTGKVLGDLHDPTALVSKEEDAIKPPNEYVASKATGEQIVADSSVPYNIVRLPQLFGPRQSYGLIPYTVACVLQDYTIELYSKGMKTRDWLHTSEAYRAIFTILEKAPANQVYNLSAGWEFTELEMVQRICNLLGKGHDKIRVPEGLVLPKAPNGDRFAMDGSKLKALGWQPKKKFMERLEDTVGWYEINRWALYPLTEQSA